MAGVLALLAAGSAHAANLLEQFQVITTGAPAYSQQISLAQTGDYSLQLTDHEFPAPLDYVDAGVVRGAALVGMQSGVGTTSFSAHSGTQTLYVVGAPAAAEGSGSFGVAISPDGGAPVVSSVGTLEQPADTSASTIERDFTVTTPAQYTLTLDDRVFPAALDTLEATVIRLSDQTPVATLSAPGSIDFDADAGDYQLFIVADTSASAGLFSYELASAALGTTVLAESGVIDHAVAGSKLVQQSLTLDAGQSSLVLTDFQFPGPLQQLSARIMSGADVVASLDAAGEVAFNATDTAHLVLVYAQAAAAGSGSFGATLNGPNGTPFEAVDVASLDETGAPDGNAASTSTARLPTRSRSRTSSFRCRLRRCRRRCCAARSWSTRSRAAARSTSTRRRAPIRSRSSPSRPARWNRPARAARHDGAGRRRRVRRHAGLRYALRQLAAHDCGRR
jgi:hypothetical protein